MANERDYNNQTYISTDTGQALIRSEVFSVSPAVTPNYWTLKANDKYIPPLGYSIFESVHTDGKIWYQNWQGTRKYSGNVANAFGGFTITWHDPVLKDLNQKLLSKITDESLNLAMSWFERKEAFKAVTSKAILLTAAARQTRKGKFKQAARTLGVTLSNRKNRRMRKRDRIDQFSDNWLELRYGWTPLYYDIHTASIFIERGINDPVGPSYYNVRTSTSGKGKVTIIPPNSCSSANTKGAYTIRKGAGIDYRITDPEYVANEALGLHNPGLLAWELLPFSFVADWFIPIGDALQSLTAYGGLHLMGGYVNTKTDKSWSMSSFTYNTAVSEVITCSVSNTEQSFTRGIISSFSEIRVDPWQLRNGMNAVRCLDAVTLLQSVLRNTSK